MAHYVGECQITKANTVEDRSLKRTYKLKRSNRLKKLKEEVLKVQQ